jgi:Rad3-related DNA helicase
MSGTLTKMTMEVMGAWGSNSRHFDYPRPFDPARSPVYRPSWAPRLTKRGKTTDEDIQAMLALLDQFVGRRLDRKGLIQTGSYERRDLVLRHSRHRGHYVTHEPRNTADVVERFKAMDRNGYLVSPSVHTGFDFPYDTCRVNVLVKVPYGDNRERANLAKARSEANPGWSTSQAIQKASQGFGRGMRYEDDGQECLVCDGSWGGVLWRNKEMATQWVKDLDRKVEGTLPEPVKW